MNLLLDTHAFLWWVTDDTQLSTTVRNIIVDPTNTIYFSVISAWEIIIKYQAGKLTLPETATTYISSRLAANNFSTLPVEMPHVLKVASLPNYHRDPFDRLLIAQSQVQQIPLATVDALVRQYPVSIIW